MSDTKLSPFPCSWCGGEVKKPRRTWCSDACVLEFTRRNHQAAFRLFVWEQSNKHCHHCRVDLEALDRLIHSCDYDRRTALARMFEVEISNVFQADHTLPQALGGDELDPKLNGRVLCLRCHKLKTTQDIRAIKEFKSKEQNDKKEK